MALGDPYATLAQLKDYVGVTQPPNQGNTSEDLKLTDALSSASEEIERYCGRQFNQQTGATTRVYIPENLRYVQVDDFWDTSLLVVRTDPSGTGSWDVTMTSDQYELYPLNGVRDGRPGWPYNELKTVGGTFFPRYDTIPFRHSAVVQLTAQWGWASVPAPVHQACLALAARNYELKNALLGVAGFNTFGPVRVRDDPTIAEKIKRFRRNAVQVG